jgi:hypothetical protein
MGTASFFVFFIVYFKYILAVMAPLRTLGASLHQSGHPPSPWCLFTPASVSWRACVCALLQLTGDDAPGVNPAAAPAKASLAASFHAAAGPGEGRGGDGVAGSKAGGLTPRSTPTKRKPSRTITAAVM